MKTITIRTAASIAAIAASLATGAVLPTLASAQTTIIQQTDPAPVIAVPAPSPTVVTTVPVAPPAVVVTPAPPPPVVNCDSRQQTTTSDGVSTTTTTTHTDSCD
ncbi:hypothetical protein SAMN05216548_102339 [Faunimonas pinastri]|uniref:Uncharacterized protein n=1 Tax=Faunimonas pinastri TaxID=1855383 RepID=A0A1H9D3S1_9HYPH|nr:hypothetical protein [Faunimonas pinastri]SEQ07999.1 hypothetical protein SAMN05216548_102339 [Faunimonas pinastri]